MFKFKKAVAGVAKETFECECCGTPVGNAPTGCGCGSAPVTSNISCDCSNTPAENAKSTTSSECGCSSSAVKE